MQYIQLYIEMLECALRWRQIRRIINHWVGHECMWKSVESPGFFSPEWASSDVTVSSLAEMTWVVLCVKSNTVTACLRKQTYVSDAAGRSFYTHRAQGYVLLYIIPGQSSCAAVVLKLRYLYWRLHWNKSLVLNLWWKSLWFWVFPAAKQTRVNWLL